LLDVAFEEGAEITVITVSICRLQIIIIEIFVTG
jgi:hypothetical protein